MSGIATFTRVLSKKISHTSCKILDTRKTTPNFRYPEKWAVLIGGGYNHRMGLFDSIMIKDTHIDSFGSISKVLEKTKKYIISKNLKIPVIVETRNINEIKECLKFDWIDRILLDNMNVNQIQNALKLINNKIKTEASGNISSKNIVEIAETGVDYISVGALTHSYKSIDFSMKVI
jgi:nicotinate-nucleotide pyrophosphorylase (carboxylating)